MSDEPIVNVWPHGTHPEHPDGPPTAVVTHHGIKLELRFAPEDYGGEGNVQELRVLPEGGDLAPRALRRFAPDAEKYLLLARAAMQFHGPFGTREERQAKLREAVATLRKLSGPGRRHTAAFYEAIGQDYNALVAGGEPHPVKALAQAHHVGISAASRWIKEARDQKFIPRKEAKDAG